MPKPKSKKLTQELTTHQTVSYSLGDGALQRDYNKVGTYLQLRALRKDPTIAIARTLLISTVQSGSWNIEADDGVSERNLEFMKHILALREDFIYSCLAHGRVDYGWVGFEKIFKIKDNRIVITELKQLLHDMTHILITPQGRFNGYRQNAMGWGGMESKPGTIGPVFPVDIPVEKSLHIAFDVEAGYLYGAPLLENIRAINTMWDECNDGARRYDKKLAGSHWVIHYPPGTGYIDGEVALNAEIAALVLDKMISNGSVSLPTTSSELMQEIPNIAVAEIYKWSVELIDDKGGKQKNFNDRLKYLDAQKVRGLLIPERTIQEGQFGTKAEAGVHADFFITNCEEIDKHIVRMVNTQLIDQLVEWNFGPAAVGKIRLVALPLIDKQIKFFRELYMEVTDPDLDVDTLRSKLDLPKKIGGNVMPEVEKDDDKEKDDG